MRGTRSTSDLSCCMLFANPLVRAASSGDTPHSTLYTFHLHSTLHTLHSTLQILHFTLYTSALHTLHSTLYTHTPHSTLYTPLRSTLYTQHTPHSKLYTPHSSLYTPNSTLYTLYSTLYTPHFTPHAPQFALRLLPHFCSLQCACTVTRETCKRLS